MTEKNVPSLIQFFLPFLDGVRLRCGYAILLVALPSLLGIGLLWAVKALIDDVFVAQQFHLLPLLLGLYAAIGLGKAAMSYVGACIDAAVTERITLAVRVRLFNHVLRLSPGSLSQHNNSGDLLTRLSGDADRVETLIYSGPLGLWADVVAVILFTASLLLLSWKLTLCALALSPLFLLAGLLTTRRIRRTARAARWRTGQWIAMAEQRLNALPTVQAAGAEASETAVFHRLCDKTRKADVAVAGLQAATAGLVDLAAIGGGLVLLLVGALGIRNGELSPGALIAFLGALGSLYGPIRSIAKTPGRFQEAAARAQRIRDLLKTQSVVADKPTALSLSKPRGVLAFNNVVFGYSPSRPVLRGVSLTVEPGETVAVVGASGSGKTTLIRLAARLYDPWAGSVHIDNHDLRDVTLASVRQVISVVWQEPHLFAGSLAQNIAYGLSDVSAAKIAAAGRAASLTAVTDGLRGGYESPVGPAGRSLSGGQRQRIALARALLRDSPILLLDEATGSVDTETEEQIQLAINRLAGSRAMLIVAHRLSSIRRADRIIVLENGGIVESGSPAYLLRRDSRCRALFETQLTLEGLAA